MTEGAAAPARGALLASLDGLRLDGATKGLPSGGGPIAFGDVGRQGWNLLAGDLPLPVLALRDAHMRNNLTVMRRFAEHHGVRLAPHGKTTCAPQLFRDQIDIGGAWGITVANVQQAWLAAGAGAENVLIANEVVGPAAVRALVELRHAHAGTRFMSLVDSIGAADQLIVHEGAHLRDGERFEVLLEIGFPGGRTGTRTLDQARAIVGHLMAHNTVLDLAGVETYEGLVGRPSPEETIAEVDRLLATTVEAFHMAAGMGAFGDRRAPILTAGGSVYFDRVVARFKEANLSPETMILLRGGSSIAYDHGAYRKHLQAMNARGGLAMPEGQVDPVAAFTPALELWASVLSLQDEGVAVLNIGMRDMPFDLGYPIPLRQVRDGREVADLEIDDGAFAITAANDQHAYMRFPAGADIAIGDTIVAGISHPCTAFDKWDVVLRIDEAFNVIGAIKTFF